MSYQIIFSFVFQLLVSPLLKRTSTQKTGDNRVAPAELEAILLSHSSVEDAAVVPLPNEDAGEIPAASVVLSKGARESEDDIMNYVASNVASYKKVRVVHFVEAIPKSPSGKIMRRLIKERMVEKIKANSNNF
ncbi:putative long-chain-fatty-acid--CoA ligase [Lupinus albus]|uniref:Putative long-chain-fatty-acid--CoA ligase n=1 Tax=Lupinus albus TaxID=3870 RepID=A0A6A4PEE4_LUPAL|nr:putative long-chain-fatty-acid--CoA ligase [Lupinus albus]